jgi:hypothetical protein
MDNIAHLGLDVHKDTIAVAILRPGDLSLDQRVIANTPEAVRKLVARCGGTPPRFSPATRQAPPATIPTGCSPRWVYGATSSPRRSPRGEWGSG